MSSRSLAQLKTLIRRPARLPLSPRPLSVSPLRPFSTTVPARLPRKDSQDKDSINTEATEYSKSGTDDQAAHEDQAAFDPNQTAPETEKQTADQESGVSQRQSASKGSDPNPLEVSPANPEVSKQRDPQEGGAESSSRDRERASGSGSPRKNKPMGTGSGS
ncbi:MAG: hypothetical protein M1817_003212 [Caeruleum heppii]|nr:MAG: hypothetical protein M1817_003212 [Caeruleum heppii]